MNIPKLATLARCVFALSALLTATSVQSQAQIPGRNINLQAVNSSTGQIYSVTFAPPGGSTTVGNTDASRYFKPAALAFVTNATANQLDLLVADNLLGTIYRYPGALAPQTPPNPTTATLVWNAYSSGTGPVAPTALAVDGLGDLFVASSYFLIPFSHLWEFPAGTAGSGSFAAPVLLDSNFQTFETLLEVAIAPTDVTGASGVSGGDLIVLTNMRVLVYSQASGYKSRITLLSFPIGSPAPGAMDFWPFGNGSGANYSLLISTHESDAISRYYFTNPLTAAPAPFYSGVVDDVDRMKTLFQAGNPRLFVSENGAILELGANADGSAALLATATQNVTSPQGLAVSNSFTNAASLCLRTIGCDLTGLITHQVTGVSTLAGDLVENVCTVTADPRVSITAGVWSCSVPYTLPAGFTCPAGTPPNGPGCLPVNAMCPGFDDTGKMAIPDSMCGRSGSSGAGFSLVKSLMVPSQFAGGYVQNSAVLADGTNPLCGSGTGADGAFLWAPLQAEGTVLETPNMQDITSGCGSIHGGTSGISVWGVGFSVNEAAQELTVGGLPRPLENFAQTRYTSLATTIDNLTLANPSFPQWTDSVPNIAASVSLALWGGNVPPANSSTPFGCLDQSWLYFYNATHVDADGSPQWTADLQNAANLLTGADANGNTTCDEIVVNALAANPTTAFVQTPNPTYPNAPTVLNPSGQLRSRLANLYYTINTRILGNAASGIWPLPVSVNVSPTAVTLASGTSPGSATLSWNTAGDSGCTLQSSDGYYPGGSPLVSPMSLTIPASDAPPGGGGMIVTYTVTCTSGPVASSVSAYVNVYPPPTLSVTPAAALQGTATTLAWNTNGAQGCIASSNPPTAAFTGSRTGAGSVSVTPASAGSYTYTLACSTPAVTVSAALNVTVPPTVILSAPSVVQGGTGATLTWNTNGNSGCTWSSSDPSFIAPSGTSGTTTVNPTSAGSYTYTLACTVPATTTPAVPLTVVQQPTVGLSPTSVVQGSGATLTWNTNGNSGCTWSSTDSAFTLTGSAAASGTATVKPASAGSFTYTLACPPPTTAVVTTLTVTAPPPPVIRVSPTSVIQGNTATLSWTINPGDVCTASSSGTDTNAGDAFTGMEAASGSKTLMPNATGTDTYTLTCTVPAVTVSATLTVTQPLAKITISVSGSRYADGDGDNDDKATLSWTVSNGIGCEVSVTGPAHSVPQFSPFPVTTSGARQIIYTAAGTYRYTLQCTNDLQPATTSVVVGRRDDD
ncbi:MAG TPA: hypothetical protein VIE42_05840 [Steroidobacteraceae bacterium]